MGRIDSIDELVRERVISSETADRIRTYYESRPVHSSDRLFAAFGILGGLLVALGIILIVAHNWDRFGRETKTLFAFLPLFLGQVACLFVLLRKRENTVWRESAAAFLFLAVGACIVLISQIYQISGELSTLLLPWMWLCLPLIYIMRSSTASLLLIAGITVYALDVIFPPAESPAYMYWLLFAGMLPHYFRLYKNEPESNFTLIHHWVVPLSLLFSLGVIADDLTLVVNLAYLCLFGLFYLIGTSRFFKIYSISRNGYLILGWLGTVVLLLTWSFDFFWKELIEEDLTLEQFIFSPEFAGTLVISLLAGSLIAFKLNKRRKVRVFDLAFLFSILIFVIGTFSMTAQLLVNLLLFAMGVSTAVQGARKEHLGLLNLGLLIITALAAFRFFDESLSIVLRGLLFLVAGIGFFAANLWMIKRRKNETA